MNRLAYILTAAAGLAASDLMAQPSNPHPVQDALMIGASSRLADLLHYARFHNPELESSHRRWEAARERIPQAKGWPDLRLNYGWFAESVETRVGPQEHRIGVMQPIPWFGKLNAAGDVASAEAAAALAEHTAVQWQLVRDVKDTWYELAWLEEAQRTTRENIELVRQLEAVAQTRFRSGGTLGGVTKAQVELGKLQDRLAALDDMQNPMQTRLNALLNRPGDAELPTPLLPTNRTVRLPESAVLFEWQEEANPLLVKLAHQVEKEEHAIRLARKQGMPELGLGVDYIVTGDARMSGVPDSGKDAAIAMFSVNIPLWRGKYRSMVREADARRESAELALAGQANQLRAQLDMALYRFRDAERKINLYSATLLPQARSAMSVAQQNYESGKGDFLDLIDAQRVLLEFELENHRATANREQALASIEMLIGRELNTTAGGPADPFE